MTVTKINDSVVVMDRSVFVGVFQMVCGVVDFLPRIHNPIFPEFSVWEDASSLLLEGKYDE